jgi:hypothetical protein
MWLFFTEKRFSKDFGKLKAFAFGALMLLATIVNGQIAIVNGDTITDVERMDPIILSNTLDEQAINDYKILKRRVIKTMPFAKMAAYKMKAMEDQLATISNKRDRKKFIKKCENSLKTMYTQQLKNLTIGEGQVLMKLLHRETGKTSWEILKNYRGTAEAFLWQTFGSFWGHDLKQEFDPVLDYQIEHIIKIAHLE